MKYKVLLTADAARDLGDIYDYIEECDGAAKADYVLNRIEKIFENLAAFPERGSYPKELLRLGIREYRQVFFKPYRMIYRVLNNTVYVFLIADGRRDMQTLLARRMLNT